MGCVFYIGPTFYLIFFSSRDSWYHGGSDSWYSVLCKLYECILNLLHQKYLILSFISMYWNIYPLSTLFLASNKFKYRQCIRHYISSHLLTRRVVNVCLTISGVRSMHLSRIERQWGISSGGRFAIIFIWFNLFTLCPEMQLNIIALHRQKCRKKKKK